MLGQALHQFKGLAMPIGQEFWAKPHHDIHITGHLRFPAAV